MSGPGKPKFLSTERIYKWVWIAPIEWKPGDPDPEIGLPYPRLLDHVYEDELGWHGWSDIDYKDNEPEVTYPKGCWKEVPCPFK